MSFQDTIASIKPEEFYSSYLSIEKREGDRGIAKCPFHQDKDASFSFYLESGLWRCFGCGRHGGYVQFLVEKGMKEDDAKDEITRRWGKGDTFKKILPLDTELPQQMRGELWKSPTHLAFLKEYRGLSDDSIERYNIGLDLKRKLYSFPVLDREGKLTNIRYYRPNPPKGKAKWLNTEGYGRDCVIYPLPFKGEDELVICEGELDTMVARQEGFPAYTVINGANSFPKDYLDLFEGRTVYIAYDNDQAGIDGAKALAEGLWGMASSIRIVRWPSYIPQKGDVTDFFVKLKKTKEDFRQLLDEARDWTPPATAKVERDFRAVLPQGGFLRTYIDYASEQTDAPLEFHLAVGLSVLSAAIGNRVTFLGYGGKPVCLNLWSILVSPSGFYRKTTCMEIGVNQVLREAIEDVVIPEDFSRERFLESLQEKPAGLLLLSEFAALAERMKVEYMSGTTAMLTLLFDSPLDYTRITKKENVKIIKPAPSILAGSTVQWLKTTKSDIEGGFFPRFLLWPGMKKTEDKGIIRPDVAIGMSLIDFVKSVGELEGEMIIPPSVHARYREWNNSHEKEFEEERVHPGLQPFYARLSTYALKFAALYQISTDLSLEVSMASLEQAIRTIEYLKASLIRLFTDEITLSKGEEQIREVRKVIERHGQISRRDLIRETRMMKADLDKILATLLDSGEIAFDTVNGQGRPKQVIKYNDSDN